MWNRRRFITALPVLCAGCATPYKPMSADGILDTHTHFYDPSRPKGVPWPPREDAFLYRPVLPQELKTIAVPLGVKGTIVVEASSWVEDNDWVLSLARNDPFIKGLVGHLKPGKPGFKADLKRVAANRLFRGIRVGLWDIPIQPENSAFVRDLKDLAARGLTLDVLGGPDELSRIAQLSSAIPELKIVIDHSAGVRVKGDKIDPKWIEGIRMVSTHRNLNMKVSGLVEGTGAPNDAPSDTEFYRPVLDALWDHFGEDRVIFGSNWPVSARFATYATVLNIVSEYVTARSSEAAKKYFHRNAERVYLNARV